MVKNHRARDVDITKLSGVWIDENDFVLCLYRLGVARGFHGSG